MALWGTTDLPFVHWRLGPVWDNSAISCIQGYSKKKMAQGWVRVASDWDDVPLFGDGIEWRHLAVVFDGTKEQLNEVGGDIFVIEYLRRRCGWIIEYRTQWLQRAAQRDWGLPSHWAAIPLKRYSTA